MYAVGIIGCLAAAYELVRLGSYLYFLGIWNSHHYFAIFIAALICAVLFIRAWMGRLSRPGKWIGAAFLVGSVARMMKAPAFMASVIISISLLVALVCLCCAETRKTGSFREKQ
jgi:hypothetical protein